MVGRAFGRYRKPRRIILSRGRAAQIILPWEGYHPFDCDHKRTIKLWFLVKLGAAPTILQPFINVLDNAALSYVASEVGYDV
jgi:hypothetical protein